MTVTGTHSTWVTILAGGVGRRFWPMSTASRPKQLLSLGGPRPLIVRTIGRLRGFVPRERVRVLASQGLVALIKSVTGLPDAAFLVEPHARGTGPALARAAWEVVREDPDAIMVSLHSDHLIRPAQRFRDVLDAAVDVARREQLLMTVAIPPDRPETGFGYLKPAETIPCAEGHRAYRVAAFVEKPDRDLATAYVASGFRWNSGIFVWSAQLFLDEVRAHAPGIARALVHLEAGDIAAFFDETEAISVDQAVLERSSRVGSIDATFQWDDMGSWEALARHQAPDAAGNVTKGDVRLVRARNNLAVADSGRLVLLGVDDLLVVQTDHATLVMPRTESSRLKQYLGSVKDS